MNKKAFTFFMGSNFFTLMLSELIILAYLRLFDNPFNTEIADSYIIQSAIVLNLSFLLLMFYKRIIHSAFTSIGKSLLIMTPIILGFIHFDMLGKTPFMYFLVIILLASFSHNLFIGAYSIGDKSMFKRMYRLHQAIYDLYGAGERLTFEKTFNSTPQWTVIKNLHVVNYIHNDLEFSSLHGLLDKKNIQIIKYNIVKSYLEATNKSINDLNAEELDLINMYSI